MKPQKPTQKDIAKLAGVSQALVSLVVSDASAPVAREARLRVLDAAQKLKYKIRGRRRKFNDRKLLAYIRPAIKRSESIDEGLYDAYESFFGLIQNSLVEKTYAAGFEMIERPYTNPTEITHWLIEWGAEGVFWHSDDKNLAGWIADRYPTVQINRHLKIKADSVLSNQEEIVLLAIGHLRRLGHHRIALLSQERTDFAVRERDRAYTAYMRRHKLPCYMDLMHERDLNKILAYLTERPKDGPSALILGDFQALILQEGLRRKGFSLPKDLSMVGIDNVYASRFSAPRLTSIDIQIEEIVDVALALMKSRIEGKIKASQKIQISPRMVVRDSVFSMTASQAPAA